MAKRKIYRRADTEKVADITMAVLKWAKDGFVDMTAKQIADKFGATSVTVNRVLETAGVKCRPPRCSGKDSLRGRSSGWMARANASQTQVLIDAMGEAGVPVRILPEFAALRDGKPMPPPELNGAPEQGDAQVLYDE